MTYSGNKASYSEIIQTKNSSSQQQLLSSVSFSVQYIILDQSLAYSIESPFDGFLNIIFSETSDSCISPYFLNQESFLMRGGENIIHAIKSSDTMDWRNINSNNVAIAIFIPNHTIQDLSIKFKQNISRFKNGLLTKSDRRITLLINQILELSKQEGNLIQLRIQSLIIDVLVHQVEGLFVENEKQEIITNKSHYDKVILAKQFIEKDLTKNYTIPELSKLVGTNEQYLKKHFKQYFGKTVLNYTTDQKMNHAKELIMTGEYRVSDVARLTGYKHSTHFTTAFKKYFGFIPNSLRYTFLVAHEGTQQVLSELENFIGML